MAFWASQVFRVDKKTGIAAIENPFEDQLQFGRALVQAEPHIKAEPSVRYIASYVHPLVL